MNYKTPGVYVEEIPLFPPSVAQVETAIPAFIGLSQKAIDDEGNAVLTFPYIKRIKSLLEYEQHFGQTRSQAFNVEVIRDEPVNVNTITASKYLMYAALQMFYANGGGPCYIVCVGLQVAAENNITLATLNTSGLAALKKKDEPTMILFPDAVNMDDVNVYHDVLKAALNQCQELGDRFVIMDVKDGVANSDASISAFRSGIGANFLKYGAAYTPWLNTSMNYFYNGGTVTFDAPLAGVPSHENTNGSLNNLRLADIKALIRAIEYRAIVTTEKAIVDLGGTLAADAIKASIVAAEAGLSAAAAVLEAAIQTGVAGAALTDAQDADTAARAALALANAASTKPLAATAATAVLAAANDAVTAAAIPEANLAEIQTIFTNDFENKLIALLSKQYQTLPPSSAMAGIYSMVDRTRGVWKAPASVSVNRVVAPSAKITDSDQESLNIDTNGKSINAIRSFTGRGIMVWGARTLAGNDNEWKYISVRRFFNMVEESVKKASEVFIFEPNDANTWVKIRAMIENFLTLQWRAGALTGAVPEDAFYVKVGLGQTMTAVDILDGKMNVEIGMAVVRPAEFIILKFSHKMQES